MADAYKLTIGDKNLSSWSLRPWLVMRQFEIPFEEDQIYLDLESTKADILKRTPSGKVPTLNVNGQPVWDSLAIAETLADRHPEKALWPQDPMARARARSVSAEMHSSFVALRAEWPMAFASTGVKVELSDAGLNDVARVLEIWGDCLDQAAGGAFLFGAFTIADAMYAPVVSRFRTYGGDLDLSDAQQAYMDSVWALPAMSEWGEGAQKEVDG